MILNCFSVPVKGRTKLVTVLAAELSAQNLRHVIWKSGRHVTGIVVSPAVIRAVIGGHVSIINTATAIDRMTEGFSILGSSGIDLTDDASRNRDLLHELDIDLIKSEKKVVTHRQAELKALKGRKMAPVSHRRQSEPPARSEHHLEHKHDQEAVEGDFR